MSKAKGYERPMTGWYRKNPRFRRYMLRELTALFLAAYALLLLAGLLALAAGPEPWAQFTTFLQSPLSIFLHSAMLVAAIYHSVTWFAVSPKAMPPVYLGARRLPDRFLIGVQYVGLVLVTIALVFWAQSA